VRGGNAYKLSGDLLNIALRPGGKKKKEGGKRSGRGTGVEGEVFVTGSHKIERDEEERLGGKK